MEENPKEHAVKVWECLARDLDKTLQCVELDWALLHSQERCPAAAVWGTGSHIREAARRMV